MAYSDSVVQAESGGNPNSQDPNSSASGPAGFIDSTWLSVLKQHRPDLVDGKSDADLLALKKDPVLAGQMADAYGQDNAAILAKAGLPVTAGTQYLAHFSGPTGAVKVLQADPNASAADILGPAAAKANPFLKGMTASDLRSWADRKMGGASAASVQPQQAAQGILNQAPQQASSQPGVLNAPQDDTGALDAFRNQLAALAKQQQAPTVAPLQPIQMAMPKGISRARLLAALSQPVGA